MHNYYNKKILITNKADGVSGTATIATFVYTAIFFIHTKTAFLALSSEEVMAVIATMYVLGIKSEIVLKYPQDIEMKFEFQTFSLKCTFHRNIN
jgi:hypothetical protein